MNKNSFLKRNKDILLYVLSFCIVLFFGFSEIFQNKLSMISSTDGIGQYYPSFLYIGEYIRTFFSNLFKGEFILPLFDLSIGMGEDIIGTLNYYGFGDPINFLAVLSNVIHPAKLFSFTFYLRLFLSGLAFLVYCRKIHICSISSAIGAIGYTFCGFAVYGGSMYVSWLSVMIFFPLMLSGIEDIVRNKKPNLFILSVIYGALCGFYFLYMSSLASAVYCLARILFYQGNSKRKFQSLLHCLLAYIVGLLVAAPVFLPAVSAMISSERSTNITAVLTDWNNYVPVISETIQSLLFGIKPFSGYGFMHGITILNVISALACIFLPNTRKNVQVKGMTILSILLLFFPITTLLFNGFGEVNFGENTNRWIFILHFVLNVTTAYVISQFIESKDTKKIGTKAILICCTGFTVLNIAIQVYGAYSEKGAELQSYMLHTEDVAQYMDSPITESEIIQKDGELYRVAHTSLTSVNGRPENVAMVNHYYGLRYWFSIVNQNTQDYVDEKTGPQYWRSYGLNDSKLEADAGCKYYVSDEIPNGNYEKVESVLFYNWDWDVYLNKDYRGFIYAKETNSVLVQNYIYNNQKGILECDISSEQDGEIIISLPYNGRWKVSVNDTDTVITKYGMYLCVPVEQGISHIRLEYHSTPFVLGLAFSVLGCLLWVLLGKQRKRLSK